MKIAAIIAEYNPFHNGHLYQIQSLKNILNVDKIIVVMSGDFVQRGIPAITDKYSRACMALQNGADLVYELPSYFALGSAEYFAQGAVSLIDKLGVVDILHFGSECGDIKSLTNIAEKITNESHEYKQCIDKYSRQGLTFPIARGMALKEVYNADDKTISEPNNILGIEYIKSLIQRKSAILPATLRREGSGYSCNILENDKYASANAIRKSISETLNATPSLTIDNLKQTEHYIPSSVFKYFSTLIEQNSFVPIFADDFSQLLNYRLLGFTSNTADLSKYYDLNINLANTFINNLPNYVNFSQYALACKSKNMTYTRICRCLMHILLDMKQDTIDALKSEDYCQYARLLGFNESGKEILRMIKSNSSIPIITKPSKALRELSGCSLESFKTDIHCSDVYQTILFHKHMLQSKRNGKPSIYTRKNELTQQIIKLPDI